MIKIFNIYFSCVPIRMTFERYPNALNQHAVHRFWWLLPVMSQQFGNFSTFYDGFPVNWPNCQLSSVSMHFSGRFSE